MRPLPRRAVLLSTLAQPVAMAAAQATRYPDRPLTWIVPYTPAGVTDNTSRLMAKKLSERLKQSVVVENRPGASGTIGAQAAARAAPDGYTLFYGTQTTHATNVSLFRKLPYDPVKDFIPVHGLSASSTLVVVNPERPYRTLQELIAYARANPGKVNFGSAGIGTGPHLSGEIFQLVTGTHMTHVPYQGSGPAVSDLIGGTLDVMFDYASVTAGHIQSGRLRGLGVLNPRRFAVLPDVPTAAEMGVTGADIVTWSGIFVPTGTPDAIVARLATELDSVLADDQVRDYLQSNGSEPLVGLSGDKFRSFLDDEIRRWREVVTRSGIQVQ